jgi:hypothetical protein
LKGNQANTMQKRVARRVSEKQECFIGELGLLSVPVGAKLMACDA